MKTARITVPMFCIGFAALFFAATALAQNQCVDTNSVKYLQPPNLAGYDVSDGSGYLLADDFVCTNTGPITGIHIWGSWLDDVHGVITNFVLGIYSDVPVSTNSAGQPTPSHPGNLLWTESFPAGQFVESIFTIGQEHFISPASVDILGPDTNVWYYCFFPTRPFTQTGSTATPVTYWLAVYAEGTFGPPLAATPQFGWKTTPAIRNDVSVNTPWPGALPPGAGTTWNTNSTPASSPSGAQPLDLAFELTTSTNIPPPPPCCPDTNAVKYVQPPDLSAGIDVDASINPAGVLADDFPCTTTGPISGIHLWGSWRDDLFDPNAKFTLSIWSDVPASATGGPSHPGVLLWTQQFGPGDYTVCPYATVPEPFDNPGSPLVPFGASTNLYSLCFPVFATNVFVQTGSPNSPTNFWLSVSDFPGPGTGPNFFGWKTSSIHYNDSAVSSATIPPPPPTAWNPLSTPQGGPVDFAFQVDTATNAPPQVSCMESNGVKYVQWPNLTNGLDVWNSTVQPSGGQGDGPWWLADDWVCTNSGEISDIHLWGSWQNDNAAPGTITFELYVLNDVPLGPNNPFFSHPGTNVLWHQTFPPGTYAESIWSTNAHEQFFDPGDSEILGSDSVVWYYCFNPTNLVQYGSTNNPQMYWLAAFADLPVGTPFVFGWKNTTNVQHDISVHTLWTGLGVPPTNSFAWITNNVFFASTGSNAPFDLSFKLTTPTNCCPVDITTVTNMSTNMVVVTWNCGVLQSATNVLGPYSDVVGATSPYTNLTTTPPIKFYRAKCN